MNYILHGHRFVYEIQTITQVFFPNERFICAVDLVPDEMTVISSLREGAVVSEIFKNGCLVAKNEQTLEGCLEKDQKHGVKLSMYLALQEYTGMEIPWGITTGIRPSKLVHDAWAKGYCDLEVFGYLTEDMKIRSDKASLCIDVAKAEHTIIAGNTERMFSLYIGIPFCPTRCLYCSFTSFSVKGFSDQMVEQYIDALEKEIRYTGRKMRNKELQTVYIGGGTPTTLSAEQLERLFLILEESFDLSLAKEICVEAGRPDTITRDKLAVLQKFGVSRISINPQTMREETLQTIGRKHTVADFIAAYQLAKDMGFLNINIDIILGLPGETKDDVLNTMIRLVELEPVSITVHTLAVKRASKLKEQITARQLALQSEQLAGMLEIARASIENAGLLPYYMYRQKNMLGNFENVGYARRGFECLYNVQIMQERQTILALGAGAITKTVDLRTSRIDRIFNVKNVEEYVNRIDEMIERKKKWLQEQEGMDCVDTITERHE